MWLNMWKKCGGSSSGGPRAHGGRPVSTAEGPARTGAGGAPGVCLSRPPQMPGEGIALPLLPRRLRGLISQGWWGAVVGRGQAGPGGAWWAGSGVRAAPRANPSQPPTRGAAC